MHKKIVLLTKSKKLNGYCVTGVDVDDGKWVRLMQPKMPSVDPRLFKYSDGTEPELLDVITVKTLESCPTEMHPEDVLFDPAQISRCDEDCLNSVRKRLRDDYNEHVYVYFNEYPKLLGHMLPQAAKENPYSLMIIEPEEIQFRRINERRIDANFIWKKKKYKSFRVTDTSFINSLSNISPSDSVNLDRPVYVVISLGEQYINPMTGNIEYYKLIAAVIDKNKVDQDIGSGLGQLPNKGLDDAIEIEMYQRAKAILEKLAFGVNPYTGEVLDEESVFQYPETIRSLFTAIRLLDERTNMKDSSKKTRGRKRQFSITQEEIQYVRYSEDPLPITRIVERINEATDTTGKKKLNYKLPVNWLHSHGLIEEKVVEGKTVKYPTDEGRKMGISIEKRVSTTTGEYYVTLYDINAQQFIVENINLMVDEEESKKLYTP